jgi:hypothetical protein
MSKSARTSLGGKDYRAGAAERLLESRALLRHESFAGAVYLAGRAVEGMLRAVIWESDSEIRAGRISLDTGHDLRELLVLVRTLGVIDDWELHADLSGAVQKLSRLWSNNMRFWPATKLSRHWREIGEIQRRRTLKQAVAEYHSLCDLVMKRCEDI